MVIRPHFTYSSNKQKFTNALKTQRRSKKDQEKMEQWQNICFPYVAGVCKNL